MSALHKRPVSAGVPVAQQWLSLHVAPAAHGAAEGMQDRNGGHASSLPPGSPAPTWRRSGGRGHSPPEGRNTGSSPPDVSAGVLPIQIHLSAPNKQSSIAQNLQKTFAPSIFFENPADRLISEVPWVGVMPAGGKWPFGPTRSGSDQYCYR